MAVPDHSIDPRILASARKEFLEKGFEKASLKGICQGADVTTGALGGLGASMAPMVISVLGVCGLRIGWVYTIFQIPQYHTPQCLYFSYVVSWAVTFIFQFIAFEVVFRRHSRELTLQ